MSSGYQKAKNPKETKVLVGISGGVDSAVTAALLKSQGYDLIALHLQTAFDTPSAGKPTFGSRCCTLVKTEDAKNVCENLDIPLNVLPVQEVFNEKVVDYFVHEFLQTRVPTPCAKCNVDIKMQFLHQKAKQLGCEFVATGHYVQVIQDTITGKARLAKATDRSKDQSYLLAAMTQSMLQRTMTPLGGLTGKMVAKLAREFALPVAQRPEVSEICFISDPAYKQFVDSRSAQVFRPGGSIRTLRGDVVGKHEGLHGFRIGQSCAGMKLNVKKPEELWVVGFDNAHKGLVVGEEKLLYQKELIAEAINWLHLKDLIHGFKCKAKIALNQADAECEVTLYENNMAHILFDEPQRAVTPGHAIVFYEEDDVIGGGFIERVGSGQNLG